MSWFRQGYAEKKDPPPRPDRDIPFRFWIAPKKETEITFVDDSSKPLILEHGGQTHRLDLPILLDEHQLNLNGDWKNWFTCLRPMGQACPICDAKDQATQVAAYTIIDHTVWKSKKGETHKDELKLYVVKTSTPTFEALSKFAAKMPTLRGKRFCVSRSDKGTNVGDVLIPIGETALTDEIQPVNYLKVFAPKTEQDLRKIIGASDAEQEPAVKF